jgi:uncharacterized protein YdhG (YjbR/CyaY superfamily)
VGKSIPAANDTEAYLAKLSPEKRATLEKVRKAIRVAAPAAEEGMSYGMPAFIEGKPIAGYAASANHCAYYPMSGSVIATLKVDLARYETSKGAIRFPIGKPLPATLIRKLVKARLAEIAETKPKTRGAQKTSATAASIRRRDAGIIAYLRELDHPLKKEIAAVRDVILGVSPAIREGIKWNAPSFRTEKEYFATLHVRAKDSVQLVLHLGAKTRPGQKTFEVADPLGLLKWLGRDRAMVTLGAGREFASNRAALEKILRAWIENV